MIRTKKTSAAAIFAILTLFQQGFAARPFTVDDAGTVVPQGFEIEAASDLSKNSATAGLCLKHGITDRMDIGFAADYTVSPETDRQISPLTLSCKYAFIPDLLSGTLTTSFDDPVWALNIILSKPISRFTMHGNLGIEAESFAKEVTFTWGIASTVTLLRSTTGVEISGTHQEIAEMMLGTQISIFNWLAFDIGAMLMLQPDNHLGLTTGLWFGF